MFWLWSGFIVFILFLLALDLGVFNRKAHVISISEAVGWTIVWVILSFGFNVVIYYLYEHNVFGIGSEIGHALDGEQASLQFFTGYILEKTLSIDNIFIIALIFSYFRIPPIYQHRVLYWGILGALVLRGAMIALGASLIERFEWITYLFGALLIVTAFKMLVARHDNLEPERNIAVRIFKKFFPVSNELHQEHFFIRHDGRTILTPLFIVLVVVESSDLMFAVDSIPAVFAVTQDPFIVFTSNVFAILGLRSMYFALAGVLERFRYLKFSLVFVLAFVGVKMLLAHTYKIPTLVSLAIISGMLSIGFLASVFISRKDTAPIQPPLPLEEIEEMAEVIIKQARKIIALLLGASLLLIGLAMLVLPGPAIVVIPAGLAILGSEFIWAKKLLERLENSAEGLPVFGKFFQRFLKKYFVSPKPSESESKTPKEDEK